MPTLTGLGRCRAQRSSPEIGIGSLWSLVQLERLRPRTGLDWMLEAQLATADGKDGMPMPSVPSARSRTSHPIAAQAHLLAGHVLFIASFAASGRLRLPFRRCSVLLAGTGREPTRSWSTSSASSRAAARLMPSSTELARLTRSSHHDLFTWSLTHFTHWNPDIVQDLDGFIAADPDDRYSRLAVVELLLERPEVEEYIKRILAPLPNTDADALALRINLAFNLGRFDEAEAMLAGAGESSQDFQTPRRDGIATSRPRCGDQAFGALSDEPYDRVSPMQLAQASSSRETRPVPKCIWIGSAGLPALQPDHPHPLARRENQVADLAELGRACEEAGLPEEARGWYTLAISIDPLDADQPALARLGKASDWKP